MNLQEGTFFAERYRLIKLLGRGGFSEVWLASDDLSGVEVALKVYAPYGGLDDDGARLFSQEFALVFNINHTNLLTPTYYDTYDRSPYLILPFCRQGSLDSMVGHADEETVLKVLHDVAAGLSCLHNQEPPIIHQDIKPDNIMVNDHGDYLITDFGISTKIRSTLRKSALEQEDTSSQSGGTYAYMGPERFSRQSAPVKASDIWSLGAMAFELLDGRPPFDNLGGAMQKNGAEIPQLQTPVSPQMQQIIDACLAPEPWDRPTAQKLVEWTDALREGRDIQEEKTSEAGTSNKKVKRIIAIVAAAVVLSVVGGLGISSINKKADLKQFNESLDRARAAAVEEETLHQALDLYEEVEKKGSSHLSDSRYDMVAVRKEKAEVQNSIRECARKYAEWGESSESLYRKYRDSEAKEEAILYYRKSLSFVNDEALKIRLDQLEENN